MLKLRRCLPLLLLFGALSVVRAADAPKITIDAADKPVAEVLAEVQTQMPNIQICATDATKANVTVKLTDASPSDAIKAVAKALKGTCLRVYILERTGPGATPYTAADYISFITTAVEEWRKRLTPDQTKVLETRVRERFRGMGQTPGDMPGPDVLGYDDPLLRWTFIPTVDTISLEVKEVALQAAVDQFIVSSGYIVLLEDGVEGTATVSLKDSAVEPILDKLAEAGKAKWREFYLVSQPVKLSDAEADKRVDQAFGEMWSGFWSSPKDERARDIQRVSENLGKITPQQAQFIKAMPMANKMFTRLMKAAFALTPDQRQEFQPIMQAVGKIMAH